MVQLFLYIYYAAFILNHRLICVFRLVNSRSLNCVNSLVNLLNTCEWYSKEYIGCFLWQGPITRRLWLVLNHVCVYELTWNHLRRVPMIGTFHRLFLLLPSSELELHRRSNPHRGFQDLLWTKWDFYMLLLSLTIPLHIPWIRIRFLLFRSRFLSSILTSLPLLFN